MAVEQINDTVTYTDADGDKAKALGLILLNKTAIKVVVDGGISVGSVETAAKASAAPPVQTERSSDPLSQDLQGNLRTIDEQALAQLRALGTKLDNIAAKIDTSNSDLTSLTTAVGTVQTAVTAVTAAVTALQTTVATGNASEATIAAQTASLTEALANIQTLQTTGITAIGQLHTDDLALQTLVTAGNTALAAIQTATGAGATAANQVTAQTTLTALNTAATSELTKLDAITTAINTAVTTLGAGKSLADIVAVVTGTTSGVAALQTALAAIETGEAASLTAIATNTAQGTAATGVLLATGGVGWFGWLSTIVSWLSTISGKFPSLNGDGGSPSHVTNWPTNQAVTDANNAAFQGAVAMVVGTAQTAQRSIGILCTAAGNVALALADGSSLVIPVSVGFQTFPFAAKMTRFLKFLIALAFSAALGQPVYAVPNGISPPASSSGSASTTIPAWSLTTAYAAGAQVIYNSAIYQANAAIPANTAFATGTTGATWTALSAAGSSDAKTLTSSTGIIDASGNIGAINMPSGTTAQRPATPVAGMMRFNTTTGVAEIYGGNSQWQNITTNSFTIQYLLISGGCAGGGADNANTAGGGGCAGKFTTSNTTIIPSTAYPITVGLGGVGVTSWIKPGLPGDTVAFGATASNQGWGGTYSTAPGLGGGTGVNTVTQSTSSYTFTGGVGTGYTNNSNSAGAGGSGCGGNGGNASGSTAGIGGIGCLWLYNGQTYAKGGTGGSVAAGAVNGSNGVNPGDGGNGASDTSSSATKGGNGANGIVGIAYAGAVRCTGGTISSYTYNSVSYTVHLFTSSGSFSCT
eukprot:gene7620-7684_t